MPPLSFFKTMPDLIGSWIYHRVIFLVSNRLESTGMKAVIAEAISAVWGKGRLGDAGAPYLIYISP